MVFLVEPAFSFAFSELKTENAELIKIVFVTDPCHQVDCLLS
jgi:hypothetical protein